jgi:hypothetical protein
MAPMPTRTFSRRLPPSADVDAVLRQQACAGDVARRNALFAQHAPIVGRVLTDIDLANPLPTAERDEPIGRLERHLRRVDRDPGQARVSDRGVATAAPWPNVVQVASSTPARAEVPNEIVLKRSETGWVAEYRGPHAATVEAAFGQATLPTAFTPEADGEAVLAEIRRRNPHVCDILRG